MLVLTGSAPAEDPPPLFHGGLTIRTARGRVDDRSGRGTLRAQAWDLLVVTGSNGIAPDRERVVIALGTGDQLVIPAGSMRASRSGRTFTYRPPAPAQPIRFFQMRLLRKARGAQARYRVRFALSDIDLSKLSIQYPVCASMAIIVGDDDGFDGILLDRPRGFRRPTVLVRGSCPADWPWL